MDLSRYLTTFLHQVRQKSPQARRLRGRPPRPRRIQPSPYITPISSPRRKPVTPRHSLRSRRDSPPHFDLPDDPPDDPIACGSPWFNPAQFIVSDYHSFPVEIAPFEGDDADDFRPFAGQDDGSQDIQVCLPPSSGSDERKMKTMKLGRLMEHRKL